MEPTGPAVKVSRMELFYDLVFVFAFLNVTRVTARDLTPQTLVESLLVLALLWWAWSTFALLGNVVRTDQGIMPLFAFAIMAAIFVVAATLPEAFTAQPPGLPGELVFASGYLLVRALEVLATQYALPGARRSLRGWLMLAAPPLVTATSLLVAAIVPERLFDGAAEFAARVALWLLGIGVAYTAGAMIRIDGLHVVAPAHWADRHAQIVLIALGESIISLGIGPDIRAGGLLLTWRLIAAAVLGIALIAALWWAYFDALAIAAERALYEARNLALVKLTREAYTYLHLPIIAGIILFSLGLEESLGLIDDPAVPAGNSLPTIDVYVLYGGVILYALGLLGFQARARHRLDWFRVNTALLLAVLIPVADRLPATAALVLLLVVVVGGVVLYNLRRRQPRRQLRRAHLAEERALEQEETEWRRRHG